MDKTIAKKNEGIALINLIIGLALIIVAYLLINNNLGVSSPIKKFIQGTNNNDGDTMIEQMDLAGITLFNELGEDELDDFWDKYQEYIESDEWKETEEELENYKSNIVEYFSKAASSDSKYSFGKVKSQEKVSKNLYKVKFTIKQEDSNENESSVTRTFYVLKKNSKFYITGIGE